eukprot:m.347306 g.347306  ORF g.347306 m.347306 type:complete len:654 (+) comp16144_c0_seq30:238-2199(+)
MSNKSVMIPVTPTGSLGKIPSKHTVLLYPCLFCSHAHVTTTLTTLVPTNVKNYPLESSQQPLLRCAYRGSVFKASCCSSMEAYDIVRSIGRGGEGTVWLIVQRDTGQELVLKKIYLGRKRATSLQEANILQQLHNPYIIRYYDSFMDDMEEHLCIIMEYCAGGNLEEAIHQAEDSNAPFNEEAVMVWFVQILLALKYLHSNRILHRDLKTANIFLTKNSRIKVGDFGIAAQLAHSRDMKTTCVGSPYYMSPEVCQDVPYNSKSDVWALGCVLYELCTHRQAFKGSNLLAVVNKICNCSYEPMSPQLFSKEIRQLVNSMLQPSPDLRPSTSELCLDPFIKKYLKIFLDSAERRLLNTPDLRSSTTPLPTTQPVHEPSDGIEKEEEKSGGYDQRQPRVHPSSSQQLQEQLSQPVADDQLKAPTSASSTSPSRSSRKATLHSTPTPVRTPRRADSLHRSQLQTPLQVSRGSALPQAKSPRSPSRSYSSASQPLSPSTSFSHQTSTHHHQQHHTQRQQRHVHHQQPHHHHHAHSSPRRSASLGSRGAPSDLVPGTALGSHPPLQHIAQQQSVSSKHTSLPRLSDEAKSRRASWGSEMFSKSFDQLTLSAQSHTSRSSSLQKQSGHVHLQPRHSPSRSSEARHEHGLYLDHQVKILRW